MATKATKAKTIKPTPKVEKPEVVKDIDEVKEAVEATEATEAPENIGETVDEAKVDTEADETEVPEAVVEDSVKEEEEEEEDTEGSVATPDMSASKAPERMVKICLSEDYKGCIGGQWYHLEKDKVHTVPENLKKVLSREKGLLKPL